MIFVRCVTCVHFVLKGHIHKYNSLYGQPDILRSLYSALQPSSTSDDRRYSSKGYCKYSALYLNVNKCIAYSCLCTHKNYLFMQFALDFLLWRMVVLNP